ncbi:hypothetical protein GCM10009092_42000 [Bowmanella denitrificans]|uniref:Antitoxin Xre/MbcA/ParS-like toxin-binding domain-containing protein n=1 Tax=Bowmanella denitrificans TaxID=366582 RepID=A0ABP3HML8_9ALTE
MHADSTSNTAAVSSAGLVNPRALAEGIGVTVEQLSRYMDIPMQSLTKQVRLSSPKVQTRLVDVKAILTRVRPWFDSDLEAWAWYVGKPIPSLDGLTAAETIKLYGNDGVSAVQDFITSKELGGFE